MTTQQGEIGRTSQAYSGQLRRSRRVRPIPTLQDLFRRSVSGRTNFQIEVAGTHLTISPETPLRWRSLLASIAASRSALTTRRRPRGARTAARPGSGRRYICAMNAAHV